MDMNFLKLGLAEVAVDAPVDTDGNDAVSDVDDDDAEVLVLG